MADRRAAPLQPDGTPELAAATTSTVGQLRERRARVKALIDTATTPIVDRLFHHPRTHAGMARRERAVGAGLPVRAATITIGS